MPILTYIKLGVLGALVVSIIILGSLWKHAAKERDAIQAKYNIAQEVNDKNAKDFEQFKLDTKRAEEITSTALVKDQNVNKKVAKAKQDNHNAKDAPTPISSRLNDTLSRLRELHANHSHTN